MNIIVYGRHHFPGSVLESIEDPYHDEQLTYLEQVRVANIIEELDAPTWWVVLYQDGHQHSIVPIDPAKLTPEPVVPPQHEKAAA